MSKELKDQFGNDIPRAADSAKLRGQMIGEEVESKVASKEKPKAKTDAKKANK